MPLQVLTVVAMEVEMLAIAAFAAALAAGFMATWWCASRQLAPCKAAGRTSTAPCKAAGRTPVAPAALPQPTPAAANACSTARATTAAASPQPPLPPVRTGLPVPPYAGNVPQWRLDRAAAAGRCARDKIEGRAKRVPKTPAGPPGPKTILVIARAVRSGAGSGIVAGPWDGARGYVTVQGHKGPAIHNDAVFHGFHSREEAESYWNAALPGAAVAWLPPVC